MMREVGGDHLGVPAVQLAHGEHVGVDLAQHGGETSGGGVLRPEVGGHDAEPAHGGETIEARAGSDRR